MTVPAWVVRLVQRSGRASVVCWLFGHDDAMHEVTVHGPSWVCPTCRRQYPSAVLYTRRRVLR